MIQPAFRYLMYFYFFFFTLNRATQHTLTEESDIFCRRCTDVKIWFLCRSGFLHLIRSLIYYNTDQLVLDHLFLRRWLMNSQYLTTTVLHACLCDCNRFAVTLMKNHYTFMHIRHRTCPIHLLDYCYLFLLAVYLFPIRRGIYHTSNFHSLPAQREKGGKRT